MGGWLEQFYDAFERIEDAFAAALDESLHPRGPEVLYDVVAGLGLPAGSTALDLGCGKGQHAVRLAGQFRFSVVGIDPVARHIEQCRERLDEAAAREPELRALVRFEEGRAEALPLERASVDLVLCREMIYHIELVRALAECRRVLQPGGRMVVYQVFAGDRLEPRESAWQWDQPDVLPTNVDPQHVEAAFARAGLPIEERMVLGSEGGEYAQETTGEPARRLLHAARLLRQPERYIARFGKANYDIMLRDCFWHVYRMIGKLGTRIYVLKVAG